MNITVTDQEQCKKQLRLEIPADTVRAETDRVAATLARQVSVPGFRPGHVPKSVIKTRFRKELRDEVIGHLLPHALGDAIREKDLKVIGEPSIEDLKFSDDESIDVTITVSVVPEFELADYKNIPLTKNLYKVRDEDVEKTIDDLRNRYSEMVPVEDRAAQPGDVVTVNIKGKLLPSTEEGQAAEDERKTEGEPTEQTEGAEAQPSSVATGEGDQEQSQEAKPQEPDQQESNQQEPQQEEISQQDVEIELGGEGVIKEFTESLTGARPGDVRPVTVEYPADYSAKQFAGRRATFDLEVTAVRRKEIPEANDEFAQTINGEQFKTIDELRADVRSRYEHEAKHKSEEELRSAAMEQLVERNKFEVPAFIVEKQMDTRLQSLVRQLASQGIDPRQLQLDWEGLRESQRERAEREVRGIFVLERIAEAESIEASEDEVNKEIEQAAAATGQQPEALKARLTKEGAVDTIKEQVRNRKALDLVIASADIQTVEVEGLNKEETKTGSEGGQAEDEVSS